MSASNKDLPVPLMRVYHVVIALLPTPDGGFRPIGLIPLLPRVWMRVRRIVARQGEASCQRKYLFAGAAKGSTVAAWQQAARAEIAATLGTSYVQILLDLVKAL